MMTTKKRENPKLKQKKNINRFKRVTIIPLLFNLKRKHVSTDKRKSKGLD